MPAAYHSALRLERPVRKSVLMRWLWKLKNSTSKMHAGIKPVIMTGGNRYCTVPSTIARRGSVAIIRWMARDAVRNCFI